MIFLAWSATIAGLALIAGLKANNCTKTELAFIGISLGILYLLGMMLLDQGVLK